MCDKFQIDDIPCDNVLKNPIESFTDIFTDQPIVQAVNNSEKIIHVYPLKHPDKVKERKTYKHKIAKQLIEIGVNIDLETGFEKKSKFDKSKQKVNAKLFQSVVDETEQAFRMSDSELSNWDPMKNSFEQKNFNSYKEQRYDDDPLEKHVPGQGNKISPAKGTSNEIRLYVSNIPNSLTEDGMKILFSQVGECLEVVKCKPKHGTANSNTTFGFVSYKNVKDATKAIEKYHNFTFGGNISLKVRLAQNKNRQVDYTGEEIVWGGNKSTDDETEKSFSIIQKSPSKVNVENTQNDCAVANTKQKPRLHIQGISVKTSEIELQTLFSKMGEASDGVVVPGSKKGQFTTYGFVSMATIEEANAAMEHFNGYLYKGRELEVSFSTKTAVTFNKKNKKTEDVLHYDNLYDSDPFGNIIEEKKEKNGVVENKAEEKKDASKFIKKDKSCVNKDESFVEIYSDNHTDYSINKGIENDRVPCSTSIISNKFDNLSRTEERFYDTDLPVSQCQHKSFILFYPFFKDDLTICGINICRDHSQYINDLVTMETSFKKFESCQGNVKQCDVKNGLLVIAKFNEIDWGRAVINKVPANTDLIDVHFIDNGIDCKKAIHDLFYLPQECLTLPKQAGYYKLANLVNCENVELRGSLINDLNCMIEGEKVTVCYSDDSNHCFATLSSSESINLNEYVNDKIIETNEKMNERIRSMMISDLPVKPFPDELQFDICVTEIVSPHLIYGNIFSKADAEVLQAITENLSNNYGSETIEKQLTPKVNEICVARFAVDGSWYRASALNYNADGTIRVIFLDFGNKADVPASDIYTINEDLLNHPQLALKFSIAHIQSPNSDGSWPDEVGQYLSTQFDNKAVTVSHVSIENDKMICKLCVEEGKDIATEMIKSGMGVTPRFMTSNLPRQTPISITVSDADILPVYAVSPHEIYVFYSDDLRAVQKHLSELSQNIAALCEQQSSYTPVEGELCAAFVEDFGEWYRVDILRVNSETVTAKVIDYGNTVDIPRKYIKQLPNECTEQPPYSFCVALYDIAPVKGNEWGDDFITYFKAKVECILYKMTVAEITSDNTSVKFYQNETDLVDELCKDGRARRQFQSAPPKRYMISDMESYRPIENTFKLLIMHVKNPYEFHGQSVGGEFSSRIPLLSQEIQAAVSEMNVQEYTPIVDEVCVGFYDEYTEWYRVHVKQLRDDGITGKLLDYGDELEFPLSKLKPLPACVSTLPLQAVKCSISNIKPIDDGVDWSREISEFLRDLINFKKVEIIRDVMEDNCTSNYVDIVLEDHTSIAEFLIKEGLAKNSHTPTDNIRGDPSKRYFYKDIKKIQLSENDSMAICITNIFSPTQFIGQPITEENQRLFVRLDELFASEAANEDDSGGYVPQIDEVCLGFSSTYDQLLRVRVLEVLAGKARVSAIDCDYEETINVIDLSDMPEDIADIPEQILSFCLYDPENTEWNDEAIKYFSEQYLNEPIQLIVKSKINDNKYMISFSTEQRSDALIDLKKKYQATIAKPSTPKKEAVTEATTPKKETVTEATTPKKETVTEATSSKTAVITPTKKESNPVVQDNVLSKLPVVEIAKEVIPKMSVKNIEKKETEHVMSPVKSAINSNVTSPGNSNVASPVKSSISSNLTSPANSNVTSPVKSQVNSNVTSPADSDVSIVESKLPADFHPMDSVGLKIGVASFDSKTAQVLVRHVISPDLIYVNVCSSHVRSILQKMSADIAEDLAREDIPNEGRTLVKAGNICAVKENGGEYGRAIITEVTNDDASVFFIDNGKEAKVTHEDIKVLSHKFKELEAQAIRVKLLCVKPPLENEEWSTEACDVFEDIILDKVVRVKCEVRNNSVYYVKMKLQEDDKFVDDLLIESGHAEKCEKVLPPITGSGLTIKQPVYNRVKKGVDLGKIAEVIEMQTAPSSKKFDIIVSCAVSPRLFYGLLVSNNISECDSISVRLENLFKGRVNKDHIFAAGDLCALKYQDGLYYRAFVNDIENAQGNHSIFLIDYGFKDFVERKYMWPLPEEFRVLPAQALTFQLQFITPPKRAPSYSSEAVTYFKELTESERMTVEVLKTHGHIYRVNLFSKNGDDIGRNLVMNRFAEYIPGYRGAPLNNNPVPQNRHHRSPGRILSQRFSEETSYPPPRRNPYGPTQTYNQRYDNYHRNGGYDDGYYDNEYDNSEYYPRQPPYHQRDRMRYDEDYHHVRHHQPPPLMRGGYQPRGRDVFKYRGRGDHHYQQNGQSDGYGYTGNEGYHSNRSSERFSGDEYSEDRAGHRSNQGSSGDSRGGRYSNRGRGGSSRGRGSANEHSDGHQRSNGVREQRKQNGIREQRQENGAPKGRGFPKY